MPRRAQTVRCRSQSLTASSRAMSVHRASHRAAAAGDRISNRRRTVSSSLISLNRYTTLKIAGAAHKLSTSRFSEPTFWKLPGTGHKMTIKVVTLSKVCEHRVAREEKESGRERLGATQSPAGPWPFQPRDVSPQQQTRGFRCGTTSRRLGLRTSRRLDVQSPAYVHKPEQREVEPVDIESRDLL